GHGTWHGAAPWGLSSTAPRRPPCYRDSVSGGHPHHASILGEAGEGLGYLAYRLWTAQHTPRGLPVPATAVGAAPPCHPATTVEARACPPPWAWLSPPATPPRREARVRHACGTGMPHGRRTVLSRPLCTQPGRDGGPSPAGP